MASFATGVFEAFHDLQEFHRFVPARCGSSRTFAALVRSEAEGVVVYVFVSDGRPSSANLSVSLWLAPPDEPGGGLDKLYVGYNVRIGSEYSVDELFFENCQKRIIHFLPSLNCLAPIIRAELADPPFQTRRLVVYRMERTAVATLEHDALDGDEAAQEAVRVTRVLGPKGNMNQILQACEVAAESLIKRGRLEDDFLELCDGDVRHVANSLSRQLYINMLCERSESLRPGR